MIDTSREEYWTGGSPEDIVEWLRLYSKDDNMDVKPVICHKCGNDAFELRLETAVQAVKH